MDKNKIEQKKSGTMQEGVKNDTTLRLTADSVSSVVNKFVWKGTIYWMSGLAR